MKHIFSITLLVALLSNCTGPGSYYSEAYYQPQDFEHGAYYPHNSAYNNYDHTGEQDESADSGMADILVPLAVGAALIWGMGGSSDSSQTDTGTSVEALIRENANAAAAGRPLPNPGYGTH